MVLNKNTMNASGMMSWRIIKPFRRQGHKLSNSAVNRDYLEDGIDHFTCVRNDTKCFVGRYPLGWYWQHVEDNVNGGQLIFFQPLVNSINADNTEMNRLCIFKVQPNIFIYTYKGYFKYTYFKQYKIRKVFCIEMVK